MEMQGHEVEVRASGTGAIERLGRPPLPDVVLADVMMPGMDGMETLGRIKSEYPDLPVILVTGQELTRAEYSRADAMIRKPIDFEALFARIGELTSG